MAKRGTGLRTSTRFASPESARLLPEDSRSLQQGRSAIQAVEAAVIEMEDNPIFNAGKGSTANLAAT